MCLVTVSPSISGETGIPIAWKSPGVVATFAAAGWRASELDQSPKPPATLPLTSINIQYVGRGGNLTYIGKSS